MSISIDDNIIGILENTMVRVYENNCNTFIPIQKIKKGTCCIVNNSSVFVKCVIKIKYNGPVCIYECDNYNSLLTPYYPTFYKNKLTFPIYEDLFQINSFADVYIYNIFLEENNHNNYIELPGGIYAFTLNHGIQNEIISHNYFGTNLIINDFSKHPDWNNGFIQLESIKIIRNKVYEIIGIDY
jgi:hypothetical protein